MRMLAIGLAVFVILHCIGILALAAEYHVNQDGSDDFTVIQNAIDVAIDGDIVIVHPGTYYENVRFEGKNIVLCSVDPEDAGCVESTIIDGGQSGPVVAFYGTEDEACLLSGFTITNGKNGYGGGICGARKWNAPHTKASITGCVITQNTAAGAVGASGGGLMWCSGTIENCTIRDNTAGWGGGLAECFGGSLENCLIIGNTADGSGGGLFRFEGSMVACTVKQNSASHDGGGLHDCSAEIARCSILSNWTEYGDGGGLSESTGSIDNCVISDNGIQGAGGGLYQWRGNIANSRITGNAAVFTGGGMYDCEGDILNCLIDDNWTGNFSSTDGAGIHVWVGNIEYCTISNNTGSGLCDCHGIIKGCTISGNVSWMGAGLDSCSGTLEDCVIRDNFADMGCGGGIYDFDGQIKNCLIINNVADYNAGGGLGHCQGMVQNCTIAHNSAAENGGGVYFHTGAITNCIIWGNGDAGEVGPDRCTPSYSCIQNWTQGGVGNISQDPVFATGPLGDYYLSSLTAGQDADSPCIDAGSDTAENLGLDKLTTRSDGGADKGTVDMGYHYPIFAVTIQTSLNDNEFGPGDDLEAYLSVENHGSEVVVDVYIGLILPDGSVLCIGPDGAYFGIFPFATSVFLDCNATIDPLKILDLTVPGNAPPGDCAYAAAVSQTGEQAFLRTSVSSFTISGG
ncbi:MAG TPA: right-handed parallel beta-helix repeat-containing protein [bacterium]|nr:right-handed parallel beta-helix repeat-containing protein [bacterium]